MSEVPSGVPTALQWLRYLGAAVALRAFSATSLTRALYRRLGNTFGKARHAQAGPVDLERALWLWRMVGTHRTKRPDAPAILELGTGWTHFYGLALRLLTDAALVLFDVQDNRNFDATRAKIGSIGEALVAAVPADGVVPATEIRARAAAVTGAKDFDAVYRALDLRYVVEPTGSLDQFAAESFDVVCSVDVLEHVLRAALPRTIAAMWRVLRPGGIAVHQIGLDDHLAHYAPGLSPKTFVRYDERTWRWIFENKLQYINRVQRPEFEQMFRNAGFAVVLAESDVDRKALLGLTAAAQFRGIGTEELAATRAYFVVRKSSEEGR
jgi:SAM-dependent methyltransferase